MYSQVSRKVKKKRKNATHRHSLALYELARVLGEMLRQHVGHVALLFAVHLHHAQVLVFARNLRQTDGQFRAEKAAANHQNPAALFRHRAQLLEVSDVAEV